MAKKKDSPYVYKSEEEFQAAIEKEVAKQLAASKNVQKVLYRDQFEVLEVIAPGKAARGNYKILEREEETETH